MNDRPIFIVGYPRSGTTLLQLMLHSHPRIAIPPENRFVMAAYRARRGLGDLTDPVNRRRLAHFIVDGRHTKFGEFGLDRDDVVERVVSAPPTLGSALEAVFRAYAGRFGKPRWGDKRPSYVRQLGTLLRMFPDAQVINVVRDGRDCVASLMEMPWYSHDIYHAAAQWNAAIDAARRAARRLPRDSFLTVRYEDLVAEPESQLRRLCGFLGEEFDPAMAEPNRLAVTAVPRSKVWHLRTHSPVTTQQVGSWAWRLRAWQVEVCEAALGDRLRSLEYPLSGAASPPLARRVRYEWANARPRLSPVKRSMLDMRHRFLPSDQVAALPTLAVAQP